MAAHCVLQYLPLVVVQEQIGCAHLLPCEVSIGGSPLFKGARLLAYRKMAALIPLLLRISEIDPYIYDSPAGGLVTITANFSVCRVCVIMERRRGSAIA
jgi:hypothetical protein